MFNCIANLWIGINVASGPFRVSWTGDAGSTERYGTAPNYSLSKMEKVLVHLASRTVAMEVVIRKGVGNTSPAEGSSPENGWRLSE